jgi:DNA-directed RNA polymerase II subunit RPB1
MTLNTFHLAGVASKGTTLGVPRLKEIINVSKNPKTPTMHVFLTGQARNDKEILMYVNYRLQHTVLRDLVVSSAIYYDPDISNSAIPEDQEFIDMDMDVEGDAAPALQPWVLRLVFSKGALEARHLDVGQIQKKINDAFGAESTSLVMTAIESNYITGLRIRLREEDEKDENDPEDMAYPAHKMLRMMETKIIMPITLQGIEEISRGYAFAPDSKEKNLFRIEIDENGKFHEHSDNLIVTDGSNLRKVMADPNVDTTRTTTNDICEILTTLGVEATRRGVENEIQEVLKYGGGYVNYRHLSLLCDIMTSRGFLMAITRHGINRQNTGALMRSSFEETVDILMEAAAHAELDGLKGVSENIILGQLAPIGTGTFDLVLDEAKLASAMPVMRKDDPFFDETAAGVQAGQDSSYGQDTPWHNQTPSHAMTPQAGGGETPAIGAFSPIQSGGWTPAGGTSPGMSPGANSPGGFSPGAGSPHGAGSPGFAAASPSYGAQSPSFSPTSPSMSPSSPSFSPVGFWVGG